VCPRAITPQNIAKIDNKRTFQRTLLHFIFAMNVPNNYGKQRTWSYFTQTDTDYSTLILGVFLLDQIAHDDVGVSPNEP